MFKKTYSALTEISEEYNNRFNAVVVDLTDAINEHNLIVSNVARKFPEQAKAIRATEIIKINPKTFHHKGDNCMVFETPDGEQTSIPLWRFSRNSWVIAHRTRKRVREIQREQTLIQLKKAQAGLNRWKREMREKQQKVLEAEIIIDRYDNQYRKQASHTKKGA